MQKINIGVFYIIHLLLFIQTNTSEAGPTYRRHLREVYPDIESSENEVCVVGDVVYGVMEPVPAEQPCLKCKCRPPDVQCETIKCIKKPGCKAIHKSNSCCPEYQCECEYNGKKYANGERLETSPGGECKVCYCRGGEIQCAQVSCYIRTDCEGKAVPGQCCPKYDHCPPKEPNFNQTIAKEVLNLIPISDLINSTDGSNKIDRTTTDKPEILEHLPKITIQEIIPEIKEIPITVPSSSSSNESNQLEKENDVQDSEAEQSEFTEIVHPPSVLRIGDKLLFLKEGELVPTTDASTPNSVITIIGAEGLQQGYEDSSELHESELKTADSSHILSLVKKKQITTELPTTIETLTKEFNDIENTTTETTEINEMNVTVKILSNILDIRNNKTIPQNTSNNEWLKNVDTLNQTTEINTEIDLSSTSTSPTDIPTESLEQIDSDEATTPKNSASSFIQDASIEAFSTTQDEISDMLKSTPIIDQVELFITNTTDNTDKTTNPTDVETINLEPITTVKPKKQTLSTVTTPPENDEVTTNKNEEITTQTNAEETTLTKIDEITSTTVEESTTTEEISTSEEPLVKKVLKRANNPDDETAAVFKQLEDEINAELTERIQTKEEEEGEAKKIFAELLNETSTPSQTIKPKNKESEMLQKVSNALAKLTLKGGKQGLDTSILGLLGDFFNTQYKYYSGRE